MVYWKNVGNTLEIFGKMCMMLYICLKINMSSMDLYFPLFLDISSAAFSPGREIGFFSWERRGYLARVAGVIFRLRQRKKARRPKPMMRPTG